MKGIAITKHFNTFYKKLKNLSADTIQVSIYSPKAVEQHGLPYCDFLIILDEISSHTWETITSEIDKVTSIPIFYYGDSDLQFLEKLDNKIQTQIIIQTEKFHPAIFTEIINDLNLIKRQKIVRINDIGINHKKRCIIKNKNEILLTEKEYQILCLLTENINRVTTRSKIIERIWPDNFFVSSNTIDVYISRLRKKIRSKKQVIKTVHKIGYELLA